jgi:ABC-type uncharacterized transport system permease subunit
MATCERPYWKMAAAIWWAQTWGIFLMYAVFGLILGGVWALCAALRLFSPHHYSITLGLVFYAAYVVAIIFVQVWATRESLANRYKSLSITITKHPDQR